MNQSDDQIDYAGLAQCHHDLMSGYRSVLQDSESFSPFLFLDHAISFIKALVQPQAPGGSVESVGDSTTGLGDTGSPPLTNDKDQSPALLGPGAPG